MVGAVLTKKRLFAIREALNARLAGEIDVEDDSGIDRKDYEAALEWAWSKIADKQRGAG